MARRYALELDDVHAGWVRAPGDGFFDVNPWLLDRAGAVLIEPAPAFWGWFEDSVYGDRREATIVAFDAEGREAERLVLAGALISEVELPALGASRPPRGALRVQVELKAGEMCGPADATASAREEAPAIASCRVTLHEAPPLPVRAIEALTITPGRRGLQRVVMTLDGELAAAETSIDRPGALEYLAADERTVLTRVEFKIAGLDVEALADGGGSRVVLAGRGLRIALPAKDAAQDGP